MPSTMPVVLVTKMFTSLPTSGTVNLAVVVVEGCVVAPATVAVNARAPTADAASISAPSAVMVVRPLKAVRPPFRRPVRVSLRFAITDLLQGSKQPSAKSSELPLIHQSQLFII